MESITDLCILHITGKILENIGKYWHALFVISDYDKSVGNIFSLLCTTSYDMSSL